ncbi:phosphotransferase [Marichromatium sp. AB32]|nr:phosphotransferase [Marichromatium sp. AB32]
MAGGSSSLCALRAFAVQSPAGGWRLAAGGWRLAAGGWRLAAGDRWLTATPPRCPA